MQADLRLFAREGLYGTAVIAGITVQDSAGVHRADAVEAGLFAEQLDAVFGDLPVAAAKSGMLGSAANVRALASRIGRVPLVVDPVLVSTSGRRLLDEAGIDALREELLPRAILVTPNLAEAAALLDVSDLPPEEAAGAARWLAERLGTGVVVTGGHGGGERSVDFAWFGRALVLDGPRVETRDDHGTGCLYSAAIAAALARGEDLEAALRHGKNTVTRGLREAVRLGRGRGSVYAS